MTKREREAVMELLLCACDWAAQGLRSWLDVVAAEIGADDRTVEIARGLGLAVQFEEPFFSEMTEYRGDIMPPDFNLRLCLEAAERIRLGEWP